MGQKLATKYKFRKIEIKVLEIQKRTRGDVSLDPAKLSLQQK